MRAIGRVRNGAGEAAGVRPADVARPNVFRRAAIRCVVFFALGAAAEVLVTLVCAYRAPTHSNIAGSWSILAPRESESPVRTFTICRSESFGWVDVRMTPLGEGAAWNEILPKVTACGDWPSPDGTGVALEDMARPFSLTALGPGMMEPQAWPRDFGEVGVDQFGLKLVYAAGWPLTCFHGGESYASNYARLRAEGILTLPWIGRIASAAACPTTPLWTRLGVNAVVLGAGLWLLGWPTKRAARGVRRLRREFLGGCVGCGFDLVGVSGDKCPECGRAVAGTARRQVRAASLWAVWRSRCGAQRVFDVSRCAGGAVLVVWIGSAFYSVWIRPLRSTTIGVKEGMLDVEYWVDNQWPRPSHETGRSPDAARIRFLGGGIDHMYERQSISAEPMWVGFTIHVPLWIPILAAGVVAVESSRRVRRRRAAKQGE